MKYHFNTKDYFFIEGQQSHVFYVYNNIQEYKDNKLALGIIDKGNMICGSEWNYDRVDKEGIRHIMNQYIDQVEYFVA